MTDMTLPRIDDVEHARQILAPILTRTPILPLDPPPQGTGAVLIKCENLQRTGSFKIRGAYNRIAGLDAAQRAAGVIAYSSGNHAQGVACAAALLGVSATIVMPEDAVSEGSGHARLWRGDPICRHRFETRRRVAEELARERGAALVPPYDHPAIIAGQGTLGLEILDAVPDVQTVFAPIGGGGLISGTALAIKARRPQVRVVGVEPEGAADARASLRSGHVVELERVQTIADGLRASRVGNFLHGNPRLRG